MILKSFLLALLFLTGSFFLGLTVLRALKIKSPLQSPAALALGLAIVSYAVLLIGQLNLLTPTALWIIFLLTSLFSLTLFSFPKPSSKFNLSIPEAAVLFITVLLAFLYGVKPEIFFDSWVYHLGLPKLFLDEGSTRPIPHQFFSAMPLLKEMLSTLGLQTGGESMAKWIILALSLAAPWSLYLWGKEEGNPKAGLAAAALFITTPIVFTALRRGVTEPVMASYLMLALYFCLRKEALLCGIFTGLLYACKYFSLPWCALLFAFLIYSKPSLWKKFSAGFLIAVLPWMLRNFFSYGDPFYPILSGYLGKLPNMEGWRIFTEESPHWAGTIPVLSAFQALWRGSVSSAEWAYFLGPSYLILSVLSLILFRHTGEGRYPGSVLLFILLAGAISLSQTHHLRYLSPLLAPLALLLCLHLGKKRTGLLVPFISRSVFLLMLAFHVFWMTRPLADPVEAMGLTGQISRSDYLSARFGYFWQGVDWVNQNTPLNSRILVWGETRAYGFERPLVISTVHDRHPFFIWMNESKDAEDLKARLDREGVSFIFWHPLEAQRLQGYGAFRFSPSQETLWKELLDKYFKPAFQNEGVFIYQNVPR